MWTCTHISSDGDRCAGDEKRWLGWCVCFAVISLFAVATT